MEDKKIYEMLNSIEIDLGEIEEMDDMEKERYKNNFKRRNRRTNKFKKLGIAVALVLSLALGSQTNFGQDVYAKAQSKLEEIGYSLSWGLDKDENIEPYSSVVNKEVENNGVSIKLSHVIIDKDELIISSLVDGSSLPDYMTAIDLDASVYIDGRRIESPAASGVSGRVDKNQDIIYSVTSMYAEGIETNKDMDIRIVLRPRGSSRSELSGKWEYRFRTNGRELAKETNSVAINESFKVKDASYKLNEFRYNPVNQKIYGEYHGKDKRGYNIRLEGYDNLGNKLAFDIGTKIDSKLIFIPEKELSKDIKSLTLRPYAAEPSSQSGEDTSVFELAGDEFTIDIK